MSTLAKPVFLLTVAEILFNVSGYVIHAVSGRVLGPADYGRYGLVITLTTTLIILIGNGIPTAMSRYLSEHFEGSPTSVRAIQKTAALLQAALITVVTGVFFLLAPFTALMLGDPALKPLLRLSSLIIPAFAASSIYFYHFTGIHRFDIQAVLKMTRSILRIAITVPLIISFKLPGAIAGYIIVPFLTFLLGLFFDWKTSAAFRSNRKEETPLTFPFRTLLVASWPITLFLLFYEIFISIDLYLVQVMLEDDRQTGLYNAALNLARLPYFLFYALSIVLLPALAKLKSEGNPEKVSALMSQALRYSGIILLPLAILLSAAAHPALTLFFGNQYSEAADTFRVLVFGLSLLTVFYTLSSGLIGLGHSRLPLRIALLGTLLNATLNGILIPRFGIVGSAWAVTISSFIVTVSTFFLMQRFVKTPFHTKKVSVFMLLCFLLFLSTLPFSFDTFSSFFVAAGLGGFFLLLLFSARILTEEDIALLSSLLRRKKGSSKENTKAPSLDINEDSRP
ncbi:MAG: flippase [Candidatus Moraniibacteriota bacterium]|nr:MAG: flippase [Candidatus Moranbacteria bacterium]